VVDPRPIALVLVLSCLRVAIAAAAPAQLVNKTIVVSWTREVSQKRRDGAVVHIRRDDTRQIYVSTAGRLFIRSSAQVNRRSRTRDVVPGDNSTPEGPRDAHFEGNRLVLTRAHYSGATRVTIDFDPSFTTCAMKFVAGKEGGAPVVWRGLDGGTYELISTAVVSSSCEIKDGNLFAGQ
jgi:hypothetical protein